MIGLSLHLSISPAPYIPICPLSSFLTPCTPFVPFSCPHVSNSPKKNAMVGAKCKCKTKSLPSRSRNTEKGMKARKGREEDKIEKREAGRRGENVRKKRERNVFSSITYIACASPLPIPLIYPQFPTRSSSPSNMKLLNKKKEPPMRLQVSENKNREQKKPHPLHMDMPTLPPLLPAPKYKKEIYASSRDVYNQVSNPTPSPSASSPLPENRSSPSS